MELKENVIEFYCDDETADVTFTQKRFITRIRKLAEKYPDKCKIEVVNKDGSIYAQIPTSWIRINPEKKPLEGEALERRRKRMAAINAKKHENNRDE